MNKPTIKEIGKGVFVIEINGFVIANLIEEDGWKIEIPVGAI